MGRFERPWAGALDPAIKLLLQHVEVTTGEAAIDVVRTSLDEAAKLAPDDDRVWLGRANLAIRTGDMKDAERWLNECEQKRPDDRAVWRARLKWAMATDRIDAVERAVTHLAGCSVALRGAAPNQCVACRPSR